MRGNLRRAFCGSLPALLALATAGLAEGPPPIEHIFQNGGTVTLYGQINRGILAYDDGIDTETYYLIDNDTSSTRIGFRVKLPFFGGWTYENVNEFEYRPYSTANVNIIHDTPSPEEYDLGKHNIRKIDFSFAHEQFGRIWVGQGSMTTDTLAEIDLSGTNAASHSDVKDIAAAQIIRFSDPALRDDFDGPEIKDAFKNYDGDRLVRLRYDTPKFRGFSAAVAAGQDKLADTEEERDLGQYDAALSYANSIDPIELNAGIGYYWNGDDTSRWLGSVSAIHTPSGVNATFAAGRQDEGDVDAGLYWYGKLGLKRDFFTWGSTAMAVDYYSGADIFLDEDAGIANSTSESWSLALVQHIEPVNTELWFNYRNYDYDDDFSSYEDGQAIFAGARFKF